MKRTRTDRSPSPDQRLAFEDTQQTLAVTGPNSRQPALSSQAITPFTALASPVTADSVPALLPAFHLTLVSRHSTSSAAPVPCPTLREQPDTQIHDLPADVVHYFYQFLDTRDRLAWELACKQNYRMPNPLRELRLVEQHFAAARQIPPALQDEVHLSPLSEALFSPEAKTLIALNALHYINRAEEDDTQSANDSRPAKTRLEAISAQALEGAFALYTKWTKMPGVLMRYTGNPHAHRDQGALTPPYFLVTPLLMQRMQQPSLYNDPSTLKLCWLDALLNWSLRSNAAELSSPDAAFPLSVMAGNIITSADKSNSSTQQFLTILLAVGMRNYLIFSSGAVGKDPLDPAEKMLFEKIAVRGCFAHFMQDAQTLDENEHAALLQSVSLNIASLQDYRREFSHHLTEGHPYQDACLLVCSLFMMQNRPAIEAGGKIGLDAITLTLQTLESEMWILRKILSGATVPGFPNHIGNAPEPNSSDSDETDTTLIGWDSAFDILDKLSASDTPSNPLPELDRQSFEDSDNFLPDYIWEFDPEQPRLLKAIHVATQTFRDLTQTITLLPETFDSGPFKQQLRAIADLWPHEVQRQILLDWVSAMR